MLIFTQQVPKIHGANPNTHSTVNSWVIQFFHHFNSSMAWELIHCILRFDIVYFSIASTHFPLWFFTHIYGINVRRRIFIGYKILSNGTCSSLQMIFERRFCREIDLPCGQFRNVSKKHILVGSVPVRDMDTYGLEKNSFASFHIAKCL